MSGPFNLARAAALAPPPEADSEDIGPSPRLASARIDPESCLPYMGPECGACATVCPVEGALIWHGGTRPEIDPAVCAGCGLCREICVVSPKAVSIAPLEAA